MQRKILVFPQTLQILEEIATSLLIKKIDSMNVNKSKVIFWFMAVSSTTIDILSPFPSVRLDLLVGKFILFSIVFSSVIFYEPWFRPLTTTEKHWNILGVQFCFFNSVPTRLGAIPLQRKNLRTKLLFACYWIHEIIVFISHIESNLYLLGSFLLCSVKYLHIYLSAMQGKKTINLLMLMFVFCL